MHKLKRLASVRDVSLSSLVRESVDAFLKAGDREEVHRRALSVIGGHRSSTPDRAADHDGYLEEIFGDW